MKTIILVEAEDMVSEYNEALLNSLKKYTQFYIEETNELVIPTNISFRGSNALMQVFNLYLKKLSQEGTFQIRIRL